MPVPPEPVLRAAARWLDHLPGSGVARTRAIFSTHKAFSDITPTQYAVALDWLEGKRLLEVVGASSFVRTSIFRMAIEDALWFNDADVLIDSPASLPSDAQTAATALGLEFGEAHALIRGAWGKVDAAERAQLGRAGELALVDLLSTMPSVSTTHVSEESDGFGYDIRVDSAGMFAHLEVKTTTRRGRLRIYLSRNEYETMLRDGDWVLVAIRLTEEHNIAAIATVAGDWLVSAAPSDRQPGSRWESVRLDVPPEIVINGVPSLCNMLPPRPDPRLRGHPAWPG